DDRSSYSNTSEVLTTDDDVITPMNNNSPILANQRLNNISDDSIYYDDDWNIKSKEKSRNPSLSRNNGANANGNNSWRNDLNLNSSIKYTPSELPSLNSPTLDDPRLKFKSSTMRIKEDKSRKFLSYTPPPTYSQSSRKHEKTFSYDDRL
ncbi:3512_t:CDS:1, partial [Cetraspora pellucida]